MKRRAPQQRADDDIILDVEPLPEIDLEPLSDISKEMARLTGKCGPASLDDAQVAALRSYSREVGRHEHKEQAILVLEDDHLQRLVVIQNASAPHFAFFPNFKN